MQGGDCPCPSLPPRAGSQPWLPLRVCEAAPAPCPGYFRYSILTEHHLCCSCPTPAGEIQTCVALHQQSCREHHQENLVPPSVWWPGHWKRKVVRSQLHREAFSRNGHFLKMLWVTSSVYVLLNAPIYGSKTKYSCGIQLQLVFMTVVIN